MPKTPRFIAICTPRKLKLYRVFDRVTKNSYAATESRELAERLAAEFCQTYSRPWYLRPLAWILRQPIPQPPPDPADVPDPDLPVWRQRIAAIDAHIEDHRNRLRLAGGGRIIESDSIQ
jgi:hypothetical protein